MAYKEHPRYALTEWPEYEFHEFPMMVYPGGEDPFKPTYDTERPGRLIHPGVTVATQEELDKLLGGGAETVRDGDKVRVKSDDDERAELLQEAEHLGVTVDKVWSTARIQDAIDTKKASKPAKARAATDVV